MKQKCFHCGLDCEDDSIDLIIEEKKFCCYGCKSVYEILNEVGMDKYYQMNSFPGGKVDDKNNKKYNFLDNDDIKEKLLVFSNKKISIVEFFIPNIHCSSCIWLLEKLPELNNKILEIRVNFVKRKAKITFKENEISLREVVEYISSIGYSPKINLNDIDSQKDNSQNESNEIFYQLGLAGFVFGNTMILALPEYFQIDEFWLNEFKPFFRWIMLILSIPVLLYSSKNYLISAYKGIKNKFLNIDIPISLGIITLFFRSSIEVIFNLGSGYFDSFSGLIFFLLLGKFFQRKTYNFLSFERDYKSYFPLASTKIRGNKEEIIELNNIKKGDILLIRNEEIISSDCILKKGKAFIDNSFITGESENIELTLGEKIYAGAKQIGGNIEIEVINKPSESYLTQLWNNKIFDKKDNDNFKNITDSISKYFTIIVLIISFISFTTWCFIDLGKAINIFTSILIIACPCALALSAPFTLGNVLRNFSKKGFYVKNANVIEKMSKINYIVFDKTGTLTKNDIKNIDFIGSSLNEKTLKILKTIFRISKHPLSKIIYNSIKSDFYKSQNLKEILGKGIEGEINGIKVKVGSASFLNIKTNKKNTSVHIKIGEEYLGYYSIKNIYREGIENEINKISKKYKIAILSGDNSSEEINLKEKYPFAKLLFDKKPHDKLDFIKDNQKKYNVMMIGDGLNDAGALKQSNVGISVSDDINTFTPSSDIIMEANKIKMTGKFLRMSKLSIKIILLNFIFSFMYNIVGLSFAVTGNLSPLVSAILMPLSSISIVVFVTISTNVNNYLTFNNFIKKSNL